MPLPRPNCSKPLRLLCLMSPPLPCPPRARRPRDRHLETGEQHSVPASHWARALERMRPPLPPGTERSQFHSMLLYQKTMKVGVPHAALRRGRRPRLWGLGGACGRERVALIAGSAGACCTGPLRALPRTAAAHQRLQFNKSISGLLGRGGGADGLWAAGLFDTTPRRGGGGRPHVTRAGRGSRLLRSPPTPPAPPQTALMSPVRAVLCFACQPNPENAALVASAQMTPPLCTQPPT
jgi:hypothetical protein